MKIPAPYGYRVKPLEEPEEQYFAVIKVGVFFSVLFLVGLFLGIFFLWDCAFHMLPVLF